MRLREIVGLIRAEHDFIGVARVVVEHAARTFGLHLVAVSLLSATANPVLLVDDSSDLTDEQRRRYVSGALTMDPVFRAVVTTHAPMVSDEMPDLQMNECVVQAFGYAGPHLHIMVLPLLDPYGLLATIHCGSQTGYSDSLKRELAVLASHVSVRLTHLGITNAIESTSAHQLSERQLEVARLTARGLPNRQIAQLLGVSENTVKKHLKDVFARLEVTNRTELAIRLASNGWRTLPPPGTSRIGSLVITRRS